MSLCAEAIETFTYAGSRADDGGQPEELVVTITKYCQIPSYTYGVDSYDLRADNTFTFHPTSDGSYKFVLTGGVSGVVMSLSFLVNTFAENNIGKLAQLDVEKLSCNKCLDCEYQYKKALLALANSQFACERFCEAEQQLLNIVNFDDCAKEKLGDCGCS